MVAEACGVVGGGDCVAIHSIDLPDILVVAAAASA